MAPINREHGGERGVVALTVQQTMLQTAVFIQKKRQFRSINGYVARVWVAPHTRKVK